MSRPIERLSMSLARLVAGPERRHWIDAMEAELACLGKGRTGWALGCLGAALKDRWSRDGALFSTLAGIPVLALAVLVAADVGLTHLARRSGFDQHQGSVLISVTLLTSMPFGYWFARLRPKWSALRSGLTGFALFQVLPPIGIALHAIAGIFRYEWPVTMPLQLLVVSLRWGVNLTPIGLAPTMVVLLVAASWCAGALLASWRRPPSRRAI